MKPKGTVIPCTVLLGRQSLPLSGARHGLYGIHMPIGALGSYYYKEATYTCCGKDKTRFGSGVLEEIGVEAYQRKDNITLFV